MLTYPSIPKLVTTDVIHAFDKLDGSNIRVEWSRKSGFSKFGTRTRLLDPNEKPLGEAHSIFMNTFADDIAPILSKTRTERATLFLEFYGDNSFAGFHEEEQHFLSLFDVSLYKKGFLSPQDFLKMFENVVPTPELLHHGRMTKDIVEMIHDGSLEGMTFEGVVCKTYNSRKNNLTMFKVKNRAWLEKLKSKCAGDEKMFERLS